MLVCVQTAQKSLTESTARPNTGARRALLGILLLALVIRLYLSLTAAMISRDGAVYIWYAQKLAVEPVAEMRRQPHHPLYPAMVLGMHRLMDGLAALPGVRGLHTFTDPVLSWQASAMFVTLLGGVVAVLSVYALATVLFGRRVGLIAALLGAVAAEFCQLSADALTDMPHLAVYLFGAAVGVYGIRHSSISAMLGAGALSGIAYLLRPEGAEVAVVGAAGVMWLGTGWTWRRRLAGAAAVCIGAAAVASPYMALTGKLVQKKSIGRFLGTTETARLPAGHDSPLAWRSFDEPETSDAIPLRTAFPRAFVLVLEKYVRSLRVTFLLPAVLWLVLRYRKRTAHIAPPGDPAGARFIVAMGALHVIILLSLIARFDYWELFSMRHVMVLAGLTLPFSAAGIAAIIEASRVDRRRAMAAVMAVVLVGPTLPWLLERRFADEVYLRRAGEWIRAHAETVPRILTTRHRVALYANGVHVWSPLDANADNILAEARATRPGWLVFDERRMLKMSPEFFTRLEGAARPAGSLEVAHREKLDTRRGVEHARVYRYHPPS